MPPETTPTSDRVLRSSSRRLESTSRNTAAEIKPDTRNQHSKNSISKGSSTEPSSVTSGMVPNQGVVWGVRLSLLLLCVISYIFADVIQGWIDVSWQYLLHAWWFRSVYFETVWATVTYAYVIPLYPFAMHYISYLDRYKVDKSTTYVNQPLLVLLLDAVVYMAPLALMDTFMVKRYCGVDSAEWAERRQNWIQTTRALPLEPPTVWQLFYQVFGSVIIYDLLFFFLHLSLHKFRPLYIWFHAKHHDHDIMHAHVTNQLSVGERVALILAANQALKILSSHPLSRTLFVPVFIWLLVENHSGYDLPWGLQHLVPAGLWGGPRIHFAHHMNGYRHYQPFMTYMDKALEWWEGRSVKKTECYCCGKKRL